MNLYHIVYRINAQDVFSKGHNVKETDELSALHSWRHYYPDAIFISLIKLDV